MVDNLNKYCSRIKKKNKHWHPETLYWYLERGKEDFLSPECWDYYTLDEKDFQFKLKKDYLNFEI